MGILDLFRRRTKLREAFKELYSKAQKLDAREEKNLSDLKKIAADAKRVADVAHNAKQSLDDLDREFEEMTGLNGLDVKFLFLATAIQCARQYILSSEKFRLTADEGDKLVGKIVPKSWEDILLAPVPYDAIKGGAEANAGLGGNNHRFRTLGHDMIMGWIFGPVNILSDSLTKSDIITSYRVKDMKIVNPDEELVTTPQVFAEAWQQIKADKMNLPVAVARQALHFGSDFFTKQGLPVPLICMCDKNHIAEYVMRKFHIDTWSIMRSAGVAALINSLISYIHALFYDPEKHGSPEIYQVKTKKIIDCSNVIASASNVIYVAVSKDLPKLDVGGIIVTIYRLITDSDFKSEIKCEFITENFNKKIRGENLEF